MTVIELIKRLRLLPRQTRIFISSDPEGNQIQNPLHIEESWDAKGNNIAILFPDGAFLEDEICPR